MTEVYVCIWIYDERRRVWNTSCGHIYQYKKTKEIAKCPYCERKIETE